MIHYGNRKLADLKPDYLEMEYSKKDVFIDIDGERRKVSLGSVIDVDKSFKIDPIENFRVNIIGFVKKGQKDESGLNIAKDQIQKKYSVDRNGSLFRVEFYKDDKFAGMVLVNFDKDRPIESNLSIASEEVKSPTALL